MINVNIRYMGKELSTEIPKRSHELSAELKKAGIDLTSEKLKLRSSAKDQYLVGLYTNKPFGDVIIDRLCDNDDLLELNNLCEIFDKASDRDNIMRCILDSDEKAEKEYKKCIDEKLNLKYACTGYVKTLSALGKFEKAEQFISNSPERIYKVALDELKDAKNGKKKNHNKDYIEEASNEELTEISSIEHKSTFQFSKESILEDELEERLLAGTTVFGIPLKIFKRKGVYGRQWSFAGLGRIDLLAEDNDGNLYVIE